MNEWKKERRLWNKRERMKEIEIQVKTKHLKKERKKERKKENYEIKEKEWKK